MSYDRIVSLLGDEAESLLNHKCVGIPADRLHKPSPTFVDDVFIQSDRKPQVLVNLQRMLNHGRLGGTGYLSILPVDQGLEHSAGASFGPNPVMFDPEGIMTLAVEGGCNAVATTYGVLSTMARKYAHRIPMMLKFNHNELLTYPEKYDQV